MKTSLIFLALAASAVAFSPNPASLRKTTALQGYVPDGMTPAQWKQMQEQEKQQKAKKNFGAFGPQSFKSRSLQAFQKELEKGKASHLMPVMNAKQLVKAGKLREEDIPYMQRGGSWDNSDVKTAKKVKWNEDDKKYNANAGGFRLDWSGSGIRQSPAGKKQAAEQKPQVKKLFGLF